MASEIQELLKDLQANQGFLKLNHLGLLKVSPLRPIKTNHPTARRSHQYQVLKRLLLLQHHATVADVVVPLLTQTKGMEAYSMLTVANQVITTNRLVAEEFYYDTRPTEIRRRFVDLLNLTTLVHSPTHLLLSQRIIIRFTRRHRQFSLFVFLLLRKHMEEICRPFGGAIQVWLVTL